MHQKINRKNILAKMILILFICVPVLGMRIIGLDDSSGQAYVLGSNSLKQDSIVLTENDNSTPDNKEKTISGSKTKELEPKPEPAVDDKNRSSNTVSKPLMPFIPSEKIPAGQAVDFPVDI